MGWKPPLKTAVLTPCALSAEHSCFAPGASEMTPSSEAHTSSRTPCSILTRACSDSAKSSSPRIARSVISATYSVLPIVRASSSITSWSISVLSMSNTASSTGRGRGDHGRSTVSTP